MERMKIRNPKSQKVEGTAYFGIDRSNHYRGHGNLSE